MSETYNENKTDDYFLAYGFLEPDGWHTPAIKLNSPLEILRYCKLQVNFFREIRVTDSGDFICWQVIDKKLVYPTENEFPKEVIEKIEGYLRGELFLDEESLKNL